MSLADDAVSGVPAQPTPEPALPPVAAPGVPGYPELAARYSAEGLERLSVPVAFFDTDEVYRVLAPLMALEASVRAATGLPASGWVLPHGALEGMTRWRGLPVLRGERAALLLEPT